MGGGGLRGILEMSHPELGQPGTKATYLPPQNSYDVTDPAGLEGTVRRSSTGIPTDSTRTGSG